MKQMNRKDLVADEEPHNGVNSSLSKVAIKENDTSNSSQIPPLVIHNNFPNLTITPVVNRSETQVKTLTEGSLKISIRYADITPPLKDKTFKTKLLPPVTPVPSCDVQPSDPLLSLPKGLTILPVVSSSELSFPQSTSSKENIEPASVSFLSGITLHEIPNTNKTTKDVPLPVVPNLLLEKVPDKDCENRPVIEVCNVVDRHTVIENDQNSKDCTINTETETIPKDLKTQTASSIAITIKETPPQAASLPPPPAASDPEGSTHTECILIESEEIKSSNSTSGNLKFHTINVDPPVTQERKTETSQAPSVPTNNILKNKGISSDAKTTEKPLLSSTTVNLPKTEQVQASITKRKARLKISPRLSDTQRNQRLAQFCYNVEPRLIHKTPSINENEEHPVKPDHASNPKAVDKENSIGNKEFKLSTKSFPKCTVKLTRLPLKVDSLFLKKVQDPEKEGTYNVLSQELSNEEKSSFSYVHGPKTSEGRNKGTSISKKRKLSAEKEFVPSQGGKILRIRNGNEVMCTKIMSKTVEPSEKTRCTFCGKLTQSTNVWRHLLAVYKVKADIDEAIEDDSSTFKCTDCGASLCSKAALGIHSHHLHVKPNQYECKCPCCSESFLTDVSLACHMNVHYQDILKGCTMNILPNEEVPKTLNCCLCSRSFISFQALENHLRVHNGKIKNNQCKVCHKSFSRSYQLKCHLVVHTELRPFKCEQCGKTFRFKSSLRTHNYFHIGVHPLRCKVCEKGFFENSKLVKHMHNVHKEGTGLIPEFNMAEKSEKVVSRIKLVKVKSPKKLLVSKELSNPNSKEQSDVLLKNDKHNNVVKNMFKIITIKKKSHNNKDHKDNNKEHKDNKKRSSTTDETPRMKPNEKIKPPDKPDNDVQIVAAISREKPKNVSELPEYISSNTLRTEPRPSVVQTLPVPRATSAISELRGTGPSVSQRMIIPPDNHQESSALAQLEHLSRTMLQVSEPKQNALELYKNVPSSNNYHPHNNPTHPPDKSDESSMLFHLLTAKPSSVMPETNGVVTVNNTNEEFKLSSLCDWTGNELPFENMPGNMVMDMTYNCVLCDALYVTSHEMADHLLYYHRVTTKNVNNIMMTYK